MSAAADDPDRISATVPLHERHFYAVNKAFGRFGMRQFAPQKMDEPHWHGHIELNLCAGGTLVYNIDGARVAVPAGEAALFWAGVPHQLVAIEPVGGGVEPRLTNLYLPVDAFLTMPHLARMQVALLTGGVLRLPPELIPAALIARWYRDYRTGDFERIETIKMELNALLRRVLVDEMRFLHRPMAEPELERTLSSAHIRHVVAMVRHVVENLGEPLTNARITSVTGLHENYALTLFSQVMRLPLKKFVIRLRLLRARGMLTQSSAAITTVAAQCGFASVSQFYQHFKAAYGLPPNAVREQYVRMDLR